MARSLKNEPPLSPRLRKMVERNRGLAYKVAHDMYARCPHVHQLGTVDDVIQCALLCLMECVRRFKPRRKIRLSTYASKYIYYRLLTLSKTAGLIRTPAYHWEDRLGARLKDKFHNALATVSLEALPCYDDGGERSFNPLDRRERPPLDVLIAAEDRELVADLLRYLSPRQRLVIERRFGLIGSAEILDDIGRDLGITRERVRQIQLGALAAMRKRGANARK